MRVKLKDAFNLQMGKTPSRADLSLWGGNNKWISIADIGSAKKHISSTKECITDEGVSRSGIKVVPEGTVIMSFKLSIGKTAIVSEDMYTNEAIMAFIDNGTYCIDPNYLYHLCCGTDWTQGGNKAVMGLTLNKATLSEMEIELPTLEEQREIASTLDQLDAIIEKRHDELNMIEQLVKSRFVELFGDPDTNPFGWNEDVLSEHLEVIGGYAFKSDKFEDEGIPVLRIGNINSGRFLPVNMVYWNDDPTLDRYKMYPGDLVMSLTGTVGKDDYGNVCILGADFPEYYLNQRNAKLSLKPTLNAKYLSELLKFERIKRRLTGISRGVRQANISNKDILYLCVPIAPINLQQQFAAFVEQTDKSKFFACQTLSLLLKLANNLQSWREKQYDY